MEKNENRHYNYSKQHFHVPMQKIGASTILISLIMIS